MRTIQNREESRQLVHGSMHRAWLSIFTWSLALVACVGFSFILGCGESQVANSVESSAGAKTDSGIAATVDRKDQIRKQLVGVWLGGAYIDEAALSARLAQFTPEQSEELVRRAQFFTGTVMAIDFKSNGTLENDIEIVSPSGEKVREGGMGTWRIAQVEDDGFVVEISERHSDGSVSTSQKVYKFYDDGNHFAVSIPMEDVLGECNPLIIFERQNLDESSVLAESPTDSTMR